MGHDGKRQLQLSLPEKTFYLLKRAADAPLGQRQGGVFRLPPRATSATPPTPQRAKGYTPLTILKKKSKHKKAKRCASRR